MLQRRQLPLRDIGLFAKRDLRVYRGGGERLPFLFARTIVNEDREPITSGLDERLYVDLRFELSPVRPVLPSVPARDAARLCPRKQLRESFVVRIESEQSRATRSHHVVRPPAELPLRACSPFGDPAPWIENDDSVVARYVLEPLARDVDRAPVSFERFELSNTRLGRVDFLRIFLSDRGKTNDDHRNQEAFQREQSADHGRGVVDGARQHDGGQSGDDTRRQAACCRAEGNGGARENERRRLSGDTKEDFRRNRRCYKQQSKSVSPKPVPLSRSHIGIFHEHYCVTVTFSADAGQVSRIARCIERDSQDRVTGLLTGL